MADFEKKPFNSTWNSPISKAGKMGGPKFGGKRLAAAAGAAVAAIALIAWLFSGGGEEGESPPGQATAAASICAEGAAACYLEAAQAGDPSAQFELAQAYAIGDGAAQDLTQASQWYAKALEANFPEAQYFMGEIYYKGQGVAQDLALAEQWYSKAAAQGHKGAKERLDQMAKERRAG
jgi:TPR repeat protein